MKFKSILQITVNSIVVTIASMAAIAQERRKYIDESMRTE